MGAEPNHPTVRLKIIHYSLAGCKRVTTTFYTVPAWRRKFRMSEAGEQAQIERSVQLRILNSHEIKAKLTKTCQETALDRSIYAFFFS